MPKGFKYILRDSLLITFVSAIIMLLCFVLADAVSLPVQIGLGATSSQIHESQNITFLQKHPLGITFGIVLIFALAVLMLSYLEHGEIFENYNQLKRKNRR